MKRFEMFLSSPRWEILQILASKPSSPIELAEELNTTVSYMSQQLKLLDAAEIVLKTKTGSSEKGKPRSLFSISKEYLYLVSLSKNNASKQLISLTSHHKQILNIWSLEDNTVHYYFEKLFWMLEEKLNEIEGIFLDSSSFSPKMVILTDSKKLKSNIQKFVSKFDRKIDYSITTKELAKKFDFDSLILIYDPLDLKGKLKGGGNL